jgi:hypothetical protein
MTERDITPKNLEALEEFLIHVRAKGFKPTTETNYKAYCKMFFGGRKKDWNRLKQKDIDLYFENRTINARSKEVIKPVLRKFFYFFIFP